MILTTIYQVFSIWWNSHAQDVSSVSHVFLRRAFPSTRYRVEPLPALNVPFNTHNTSSKLPLLRIDSHAFLEEGKITNIDSHLMIVQSLAAEKMYLSSEEMTRQVTGSLCPRNTLISDTSGASIWKNDKRSCMVKTNIFFIQIWIDAYIDYLHLWQ